jgi:hypothetical protein
MLLTFRAVGFGWTGDGVLLDPDVQSTKLIAVWTELEPLPLVVTRPAVVAIGFVGLGIVHAAVYGMVAGAWPRGVRTRALRMAALLFSVAFLFWEFFTPFNQYGEPLPLIGLELLFWVIIALGEGCAIAAVMEWPGWPTRTSRRRD